MASTFEYVEFVCDQIEGVGQVRYKRMFGEFFVYVNDKPIVLICDNNCFVKMHEVIADIMLLARKDMPYKGAKEHYVLDIDNIDLAKEVVRRLEKVTSIPKPKKKKNKE